LKKLIIINGPNLNLVGIREPEIYGDITIEDYLDSLPDSLHEQAEIEYFQSNHEGELLDILHDIGFSYDGIILNAGAYTHTSIALRDAVAAITTPVLEIHISDISKRENFRKHSYLTDVCAHHIIGRGLKGYHEAIEWFLKSHP